MTDWQKGMTAFREGRMREAADRLGAASADHEYAVSQSVRFETCAYLGAALYALNRPGEAVTAFETAFRLSPTPVTHPDITLNLVHAYLAIGRRDAAREALLYLLHHAPGHVAARMLLQRLENTPQNEPVSGFILGESIEKAKQYIRTLTFAAVETGGYDPAQVGEALTQLISYLDSLDKLLQKNKETLALYEGEIERYRQMEEAFVQNLVQTQQEAQKHPAQTENSELSPLEALFQKK